MKKAIRKKLIWAVFISLLCPAIIGVFSYAGFLERFEHLAFDALTRLVRSDRQAHEDVAVILIDEASLKAMNPVVGRWPWPRAAYSDLLDFLLMGGPSAVAFDILFTENEDRSDGELSPGDQSLVDATGASGNVFHAMQVLVDEEDEFNKSILHRDMPGDFRNRFGLKWIRPEGQSQSNNYYLPFKDLYMSAAGVGVVEFVPDNDGVYRRSKPLRQYKDDYFPVLSIATLIKKLDVRKISLENNAFFLDNVRMPLQSDGRYLINMYGNFNTYSISGIYASLQKIKQGEIEDLVVDPSEFEGKVVFIGASAVGVEDVKPTAVSGRTPGVFLHASIASNVLMNDFLNSAKPWVTVLSVMVIAAASAFCALMLTGLYLRFLLPMMPAVVYTAVAIWGFEHNVLYSTVPQILSFVLSFLASFVYLSFTEGKEKRKVRRMLGQYVSPHVLSAVVDSHEDFIKAEVGQKEHVTLLFSDIRGFTTISENLSPDKVVAMLNQYFTLWSDIIFKYDGMIDKFVGDAIMAVWGAPLRTSDHAQKAVTAALEMVGKLPDLNKTLAEQGYKPVRIGIGINTGDAILGNIGSEKKLDYTVIGDTVNLASRLEGLTKTYSCDILISENTYGELNGKFPCTYVDNVKVKGKEIAINVYKVEGGKDAKTG